MKSRRRKSVDDEIDRSLKQAFDTLANEPLPDRFTNLIDRLKAREATPARRDDADGSEGDS